MTFPMPQLDDRTFQDIVDEAKRRIPLHTPEWTDHNLSDPGVALLELFAWMTESIIYRLNIVPDRLYRSFLELVGITPYPPEPATADITFWLAAPGTEVTVPPSKEVATPQVAGEGSVGFITTGSVHIRPPEPLFRYAMTWNQRDGTFTDVKQQLDLPSQQITCFESETPGDAMYFGFSESLAGNVIFLDVETTVHGVGVRPERPPLVWEVSTGHDEIHWEAAELDPGGDTTFGLNKDGRILLYLPYRHEPATYNSQEAYWLRARLTSRQPTYKTSPTIRQLSFQSVGGRVPARPGVPASREVLGVSTGKPGQLFTVKYAPVLARDDGETVEVVHPKTGDAERWIEVENFARSSPTDRHFTWHSATGEIRFGPAVSEADGTIERHGAIPEAGARIVVTGYRSGGGTVGNVAEDSLVIIKTGIDGIQRANNRKPAAGGRDAETIENAKIRGPLALVTGDRAVTAHDFEYLTLHHFHRIARVRCRPVRQADEPIRLYVVPHPEGVRFAQTALADFLPSDELMEALREMHDEHRLIGSVLEITPPPYQPVSVVVRLTADHNHRAPSVRQRVISALSRYINPVTGGPEGRGWPWGQDVERPAIAQMLRDVDGVHHVEEVLFFDTEYPEDEDYRFAIRRGSGRDRIHLDEFSLAVSGRHQVVVVGEDGEA